jgi:histidine ammonia-lyase
MVAPTRNAAMKSLVLDPAAVTLADLNAIAAGTVSVVLDEGAGERIAASLALVQAVVDEGRTAYGVNTGFGKLAQTRISRENLAVLQENLILSHCVGIGPHLGDDAARLTLALKAMSLARGHSGVRPETVAAILALLERRVIPAIPAKGSVGASGDLAPLAHMAATLIGVGEARFEGALMPARDALRMAGLAPVALAPKEGLALINGTQVSTALALVGLFAIENAFSAALVAGVMSLDAVKGSDAPFDERIHALRGQSGQIDVARAMRRCIAGSAIRASHVDCGKVQDPYSLRCQPQVMGAALDMMRYAARTLLTEAFAVTDNPLVFAADGEILSGGNFHAEPVAMAADVLAIAGSEIGAISERRIALLTDPVMSGLPAFLVAEGGLNSGFMIAHVTAAALASENKTLAHPASIDSLPTSANQEDHVSMATFGARRLADIAGNVAAIAGIELLAAAQGIDFHRPHRSSEALETAHGLIRGAVPFYERDRFFAPDIAAATRLVESGAFRSYCSELLPSAA